MKQRPLVLGLIALVLTAHAVSACAPMDFSCYTYDFLETVFLDALGIKNIGTEEAPQYEANGGTLTSLKEKIAWNPNIEEYPVINNMMTFWLYILGGYFTISLMLLGYKYMTSGDDPRGRVESTIAIKRLFVGMVVVLLSKEIYNLLLYFSSSVSGFIMSVNPDITKFVDALMSTNTTLFVLGFAAIVSLAAMAVMLLRFIMVLVLAMLFPLILAFYYTKLPFVEDLGRKGISWVFSAMVAQVLMAGFFVMSIISAGSFDAQDPVGSMMASMLFIAGLVGMTVAPLGSLAITRALGSTVSAIGGGVALAGAASANPALMAAGSVAAAGGGILQGTSDVTSAELVSANAISRYNSPKKSSSPKSREASDDSSTPQIWSGMDRKVDGRTIQSWAEQTAFAEIEEAESSGRPYNINDEGFGRTLSRGMMGRGFNKPSRTYNDMYPKMGRCWADGGGELPMHLKETWIPHWQKHAAVDVDEDGNLHVTEKGMQVVKKYGHHSNPVMDSRKRLVKPSTESNFRPDADSILKDGSSLPWFKHTEGNMELLDATEAAALEKRFPNLAGGVRPVIIPNMREISSPGADKIWGLCNPPNASPEQRKALERVSKDFKDRAWNPGMNTQDYLDEHGIDRSSLSDEDSEYYRMRELQEAYYKGLANERAVLNIESTPVKASRQQASSLATEPGMRAFPLAGDTVMSDRVLASSIGRLTDDNSVLLNNPLAIEGHSITESGEKVKTAVYAEDLGERTCFVSVSDNRTTTHLVSNEMQPIQTIKKEAGKESDINKVFARLSADVKQKGGHDGK